ncbi:MAG: DNA polymerase III subunit gamma/tau [Pseudomonadota bacterium]
MQHVVLARKYRPRSFDQMVGQAHVVQALGNALTSGRLHHAYLFTGTRGIGKTTVSRILAKSLNCTGPDGTGGVTAQPCGVCQACTEIDADRYIDYIELDAASNRSIDEIRELIERAAYKPSVGRYKVFMIDEAHQLTKDAFNALLKTLEEPPEYLKFVLATTDPEKMLPTVLSRCLQFNLRPMAPETVAAHLQQVLAAEGVAADAGAIRLLARAARGSMRDALSLTDQAIAFGAGALAEEGVRAMLGTVDRSHAAALVQALAGRDGPSVLATVDALRSLGLSAAGTLEEMAGLLQQMAVEQAVPGALDDADPDHAGARALAALLPADETQLLYSIVVHGRAELSLLPDEYAALTMVLLRLLAFPAASAAPAPAAAPRAAPLVAAPREARSTAPARPLAQPHPQPQPQVLQVPPPPQAAPLAAAVRPAVPASPPRFSPPPAPPRTSANEPPPWAEEAVPDDFAPAVQAEVEADAGLSPPGDSGTAPAPQPAALAAALPALQTTALGDRWADLVRPLVAAGSLVAMVRELAWQAELLAVTPLDGGGQRWQLRAERESLRNPSLSAKLSAVLSEALGQPAQVEVLAGVAQDSIARRDNLARETAQRAAEQLIHGDPEVQALMAQFRSARIVPGSIKPLAADGLQTTPKAPPP